MSATTTAPAAVGRALDDLPALWDGFARLVRTGLGSTPGRAYSRPDWTEA